jgi:hypothetical protein
MAGQGLRVKGVIRSACGGPQADTLLSSPFTLLTSLSPDFKLAPFFFSVKIPQISAINFVPSASLVLFSKRKNFFNNKFF